MRLTLLIISVAAFLVAGCDQSNHDVRKAQHINCVNNLKQIGFAFKIWEINHGDQYPFNVSTNAGGTMELCAVGKDGFDSNAFLHFKTLIGDDGLRVPLLLFCPQDRSKKAATNWDSLGPENVTYRLHSGTNVNDLHPREILAVCPVDGNVLFCDGTVFEKGVKPESKQNPLIFNLMKHQIEIEIEKLK